MSKLRLESQEQFVCACLKRLDKCNEQYPLQAIFEHYCEIKKENNDFCENVITRFAWDACRCAINKCVDKSFKHWVCDKIYQTGANDKHLTSLFIKCVKQFVDIENTIEKYGL